MSTRTVEREHWFDRCQPEAMDTGHADLALSAVAGPALTGVPAEQSSLAPNLSDVQVRCLTCVHPSRFADSATVRLPNRVDARTPSHSVDLNPGRQDCAPCPPHTRVRRPGCPSSDTEVRCARVADLSPSPLPARTPSDLRVAFQALRADARAKDTHWLFRETLALAYEATR